MRLREFFTKLNEDAGVDSVDDAVQGTSTQGDTKKRSGRGKVHDHHAAAIKGLQTIPEWPGQYYNMYRLGVHMAGSPENPSDDHGAFSNEMVMTAYTDVEQDMINHSAKELGVKIKALSSDKSQEPEETNTVSPIAKRRPNQYGV